MAKEGKELQIGKRVPQESFVALYVSDTTQIDWFSNKMYIYTIVNCWYSICERLRQEQYVGVLDVVM